VDYIPPRNRTELELTRLWENTLDVRPVSVRDNFFGLGGHSLAALRMMAEIRQKFGRDLSLATLFQAPTIEQLADALRQDKETPWSSLIPIQPNGTKPPFFCFPGGGGHVLYLYYLAYYLGQDQPFYGLELQGIDRGSVPLVRVEDMAALYAETICSIQAQSPYLLGGHSFGAVIAFETALQLQKQGHDVTLLAILDTEAPFSARDPLVDDWDDARWLASIADDVEALLGKKMDISSDALRALEPDEQLVYVNEQLKKVNWIPPEADIEQLRRIMQLFKTNTEASANYNSKEVLHTTRIALFKAKEPLPRADHEPSEISKEPAWGWDRLSNEPIEVQKVPGNHFTMVNEPHVSVLAEQLKACIDNALKSTITMCTRSILPENHPGVTFDEKGMGCD
jgi:thioesterase domain-containing protein/acyl carrier protein